MTMTLAPVYAIRAGDKINNRDDVSVIKIDFDDTFATILLSNGDKIVTGAFDWLPATTKIVTKIDYLPTRNVKIDFTYAS